MPWVIFVTLGALAAYTYSHFKKGPKGLSRITLGNSYILEVAPFQGGMHWTLTNEFRPGAMVSAGDAATLELAMVAGRAAQAQDIAIKNLS